MRSVLTLATFAVGLLCFALFLTKVKPVLLIGAPAPSEQVECSGAFGTSVCP
jgi:hypothetical protein